jgi:hypothetical protein
MRDAAMPEDYLRDLHDDSTPAEKRRAAIRQFCAEVRDRVRYRHIPNDLSQLLEDGDADLLRSMGIRW